MALIVGGTGALGSAVARRLLAAGAAVRLTTRHPERAAAFVSAGAEVIRADLLDQASLRHACKETDTVVAAAHSIFGRGRAASAHVDGRGHRDLIDCAKAAGVRHFVYTSAYDYGPAFHDIPIFRIKYEIEDYLKASGLSYTILRPTAFMESHAQVLIGEPILRKGKVVLFGRGDKPRNFVAADDVAYFAVLALSESALEGLTLEIGGPDNLTNMDVVRLYEQIAGRSARVTHVPLAGLRVAAWLLRPLHAGMSQILQAGVLGDTTDQSFDARPLQQHFGVELTRLSDWVTRGHARPQSATRPA